MKKNNGWSFWLRKYRQVFALKLLSLLFNYSPDEVDMVVPLAEIAPGKYAFSVAWSPEDQEYVGTVAEFPSLSWLDVDEAKALAGIKSLVQDFSHEND